MGLTAHDVVSKAELSRVLTVFCDDVTRGRREVRAATEEQESVPTLVALEWEHAPSLAHEIDEIRDALANAAASLWPNWYITAEQRFEQTRAPDVPLATLVAEITNSSISVSTSWLRQAWERCRKGRLPIVERVPCAEQVRQLSRALDPRRLVFVVSVVRDDAPPARLRGLARAAEWLAREAQAKTLLIVPTSWIGHPELDHVAYGALRLSSDESVADTSREGKTCVDGRASGTQAEDSIGHPTKPPNGESVHVLVGPIVGKPHPASEVEKLLHDRLSSDQELGALFEYNERLPAFGEKQFIVDLVWKKGRLVIEVDGSEHRSQMSYQKDRERDYRLWMSGYTTLRVTNDEVCVNVEHVVAKIRNMVNRIQALARREG